MCSMFDMLLWQVKNVRLPTHLVPEHYKVMLTPFIIPNNYTIKGSVKITLDCASKGMFSIQLLYANKAM